MGSLIGEAKHLENGESSLLIPPPKYKRRKVSAIRDFPPSCGPNPTWVYKDPDPKEVLGIDALNIENVLSMVLKDIENCGEKSEDLSKVERNGLLEQTVQQGGQNDELKNLSTYNTNTFVEIQKSTETPLLRDAEHITSNELVEVTPEFSSTLKDISVNDPKEIVHAAYDKSGEEGTSLEQHLLAHYPIPPNLVRKERKYPPPRKFSAVRNFPSGCGPKNIEENLEGNKSSEDKIQGIVSKKSRDKHEKLPKADVGVSDQETMSRQSPDVKEREKTVEDKDDEQQMQDQSGNAKENENLPDGLTDDTIVYVKDKNKIKNKNKKRNSAGFSNNQIEFQDTTSGQSPEIKGREITVKDKDDEQQMQDPLGHVQNDEMDVEHLPDWLNKDTVVYVKNKNKKRKKVGVSVNKIESQEESNPDTETGKRAIVQGIASSVYSPWKKGKGKMSPLQASAKESKGKKRSNDSQDKRKQLFSKGKNSAEKVAEKSMMIVPYQPEMETDDVSRPLDLINVEDSSEDEGHDDFQLLPRQRDSNVSLSPFLIGSSSEKGARSKVRETLRLFQVLVRKLIQGEETKSKEKGVAAGKRVDLNASKIMKARGKYINQTKVIGPIPGVEIGDIFSFRVELAIIGFHTPLQSGIDTMKLGERSVAISAVASGGYDNDVHSSDVLTYTGQGGVGPDKQPQDQKLEQANLALKNCIDEKTPVRVIRGFKEYKPSETSDGRSKSVATYTYDGLYTVENYWSEAGPHGKLVYKFDLRRIPGQRQLAWKDVKQSKKSSVREGCCVDDISHGKQKPPIRVFNTIDDEKPPQFTYITSMMYPVWCSPLPLKGCNCKNGCSDSDCCACAVRNGGEIPYNLSGAIVEAKPLVYECGPSCKCPPSCSNRVAQNGIKLPLEIFKTESRGWGVRCLSSIPSGSFICEYIGELLDDKEADERVGSDEYLFDIGQNYNDTALADGVSALMPDMPLIANDIVENVGFTIDAARYGNIGRFINHSCTPNLYAQNVLYDFDDKRIPHIMMFAAENIPPLQELTYHYNYTIDHVLDADGNIKRKDCYCGSPECTGRMY